MSNPVSAFWFASTMTGAPALSGTAGTLITVLDACLKDGFGSVTLDSVIVANGVATATKSSGHGFTDYVVVVIAGATPSGLNGNKRLTRVSSTVFTFDATGISDQTATGTITAKVAPVGWTKPYSGTNKAVYARSDVAATAMVLRVDDSPAQYPQVIMYETMNNVDTGAGPAPTTGYCTVAKSNAADATPRAWRLFGDSRLFYLFTYADGYPRNGLVFGDIASYKSGDAYACIMMASTNNNAVYDHSLLFVNNTTNSYLSRSFTQLGAAIASARYTHSKNTYIGNGGSNFPSQVNNGLLVWPIECWEGTANARGILPGCLAPIHYYQSLDGVLFTNFDNLPNRNLLLQGMGYSTTIGAILMDITGPWR